MQNGFGQSELTDCRSRRILLIKFQTFRVGTGLSDAQRRKPPKIGAIIVYRFQELTPDGVPRYAQHGSRIKKTSFLPNVTDSQLMSEKLAIKQKLKMLMFHLAGRETKRMLRKRMLKVTDFKTISRGQIAKKRIVN